MESNTTVFSLAAYCKVQVSDLRLVCNFCGKILKNCEKIAFQKYELKLRWLSGTPYACCKSCLRISGLLEFKNYFERNLLASEVRACTGTPLWCQQIRCLGCLKPLTTREKKRLDQGRVYFYLVRGRHLRSHCTFCRLYYNAK